MKRNDGRDGRDEEIENAKQGPCHTLQEKNKFIGKKVFLKKLKVEGTKSHQKSVMCLDL